MIEVLAAFIYDLIITPESSVNVLDFLTLVLARAALETPGRSSRQTR